MAPQGYPDPREDSTRASMEVLVGTIGHEGEFSAGELAPWLASRELAPPDGMLHCYQCSCNQRDSFLVHPTSDCTAGGGEYVIGGSRGVLFGSRTYIAATTALAEAVAEERACISTSVGLHTHVGWQKKDGTDMDMNEKRRLVRNFLGLQTQIRVLAAGAFDQVRPQGGQLDSNDVGARLTPEFFKRPIEELGYRLPSRCSQSSYGSSPINFSTGKHTIEFRVWNAARSQWRMVLAGGVSVAMVEAACQGREVRGLDEEDLTDHLEGLLPADVLGLIDRQRTFHAGGTRA